MYTATRSACTCWTAQFNGGQNEVDCPLHHIDARLARDPHYGDLPHPAEVFRAEGEPALVLDGVLLIAFPAEMDAL